MAKKTFKNNPALQFISTEESTADNPKAYPSTNMFTGYWSRLSKEKNKNQLPFSRKRDIIKTDKKSVRYSQYRTPKVITYKLHPDPPVCNP